MSKTNVYDQWRRIIRWCSFSMVIMLLILFEYQFSVEAQGNGVITGKVTGDDNVPLTDVTVNAYYKQDVTGIIQWTYTKQTKTDNAGNYTIADLDAGIYHIWFDYPSTSEYYSEFYDNAKDQYSATDINLDTGATINNINAQLSSGAHIKGQVTDLQGNPLSNIRVSAWDKNNTAPSGQFYDTGTDGRYDIDYMQPGSYRVSFGDLRQPPLYRIEHFDNQKVVENATFVTLTVDQTLSNINAKLDQLGFISGKVTDAQGKPLSWIQLVAQQSHIDEIGETWLDRSYTSTDESGNYILGGLEEGAYRIRFGDPTQRKYSKEYYNDSVDPKLFTPVTVTLNTTTTNINAQLALRGAISGKITNRQGESLSQVEVTAEEQDMDLPVNRWNVASVTRSNNNGEYVLCCLNEGSYRLRFNDTQSRYIGEYYNNIIYDYHSLLDDVTMVQVTSEVTTTGIDAQLNRPSKLISIVTDPRNQPIADISVTLYRYNPAVNGQWDYTYSYPKKVNDAYVIGVIPGRYRIQFKDGRDPERYVGEFYDNTTELSTATDITITEESTVTIHAALADKTRIDGRVTDRNNSALPNIDVVAWRLLALPELAWRPVASTATDQNGRYSLTGLAPDAYRVSFALRNPPDAFAGTFYDNKLTLDTATDIVVREGIATLNIDAHLGRPSHISGRVSSVNGELLSEVYVSFYCYVYDPNGDTWYRSGITQTDENGLYSSPPLTPGLYRIGFQDYNNLYRETFYSNVDSIENATIITLSTEITLTDINAQLVLNSFIQPPFAQSDQILVVKGGIANSLSNGMSSVLANDYTNSGRPLQAYLMTRPTHGTLIFNQDGTFIYTHNGDESTSDFFDYYANDGIQVSYLVKVHITIQPINDPPIARNDSVSVGRGQRITTLDSGAKSLLANDSDPDNAGLTATLKGSPLHGTVTINANGAFTYTHDGSASDSDSFTYQATDALGASAVATVTVAINPFTFSKTVSIAGIKPLCTPVDEMRVPVGTTIVYCYTIRNIGDLPLTTHTLVDSHLGTLLTNHSQSVAAGTAFSVTFTQTLTVSTTNIATWTATSLTGQSMTATPPSATAKKAATITMANATDDSDGDGIPDNLEKAGDIDGDNLPNFLDTDADGDGKLDKEEVGSNPAQPLDSNQNGVPDYLENQSGTLKQQKLFLPVINR